MSKSESQYIDDINNAKSLGELKGILCHAEVRYNLWPSVLGRIIDAKLNRELELYYENHPPKIRTR